MTYPHHGLIQPAIDTLAELGKMLPLRWYLYIHAHSDGSVGTSVRRMDNNDEYYPEDLPIEDETPYDTPDLIRLVKHVRKLEGLE